VAREINLGIAHASRKVGKKKTKDGNRSRGEKKGSGLWWAHLAKRCAGLFGQSGKTKGGTPQASGICLQRGGPCGAENGTKKAGKRDVLQKRNEEHVVVSTGVGPKSEKKKKAPQKPGNERRQKNCVTGTGERGGGCSFHA